MEQKLEGTTVKQLTGKLTKQKTGRKSCQAKTGNMEQKQVENCRKIDRKEYRKKKIGKKTAKK